MEFSYLFDFFLLFILKNTRNVWLTEKRGELVFGDNDAQRELQNDLIQMALKKNISINAKVIRGIISP